MGYRGVRTTVPRPKGSVSAYTPAPLLVTSEEARRDPTLARFGFLFDSNVDNLCVLSIFLMLDEGRQLFKLHDTASKFAPYYAVLPRSERVDELMG